MTEKNRGAVNSHRAFMDVSDMIETKPLSDSGQADYLNAVARIRTDLPPDGLLDRLQAIEELLGRIRNEKWGDRTIDLDILLYGDKIVETERLVVPHSQMHLRTLVLQGMCELAADLNHPVLNRSIFLLRNHSMLRSDYSLF